MPAGARNKWYPRLKELYDREPFRPFWIRTSDGSDVQVKQRGLILFAPRLRTIHVATGRGEETKYIDAGDVVEVSETIEAKRRNGR